MEHLVSFIFGAAVRYVLLLAILTMAIMGAGNYNVNKTRNDGAASKVAYLDNKYTESYKNSIAYLKERESWYVSGCYNTRDLCGDNSHYTHVEYMNHRFNDVYDRVNRDDSFRIRDVFFID